MDLMEQVASPKTDDRIGRGERHQQTEKRSRLFAHKKYDANI